MLQRLLAGAPFFKAISVTILSFCFHPVSHGVVTACQDPALQQEETVPHPTLLCPTPPTAWKSLAQAIKLSPVHGFESALSERYPLS